MVAAGGLDGALATDEFDPNSLPDFFGAAQQDGADLAGGANVGAAASGEIEVVDVDQPELRLCIGR